MDIGRTYKLPAQLVSSSAAFRRANALMIGEDLMASYTVVNDGPFDQQNYRINIGLPVELECGSHVPVGQCLRFLIFLWPPTLETQGTALKKKFNCTDPHPAYRYPFAAFWNYTEVSQSNSHFQKIELFINLRNSLGR